MSIKARSINKEVICNRDKLGGGGTSKYTYNNKESEIKLPTFVGSSKKQGSSRKTSTSALLTMPKPLTVWITTNWKILKEM